MQTAAVIQKLAGIQKCAGSSDRKPKIAFDPLCQERAGGCIVFDNEDRLSQHWPVPDAQCVNTTIEHSQKAGQPVPSINAVYHTVVPMNWGRAALIGPTLLACCAWNVRQVSQRLIARE